MGTYNLPTTVAVGDSNHHNLHNNANTAINGLDTRLLTREVTSEFVPATSFQIVSGTPTITAVAPSLLPAWQLNDSTTQIVSSSFYAPPGWLTADVYAYTASISTAAGNAQIQGRYFAGRGINSYLNTSETGMLGNVTLPQAASTQYQLHITRLGTAIFDQSQLPLRTLHGVSFRRIGADAGDTLVGDLAFYGVELRRLT